MEDKPDVIIVFASGAFLAKDIFHSPNYWMAKQAKTLALRYGIPIVTQWDIAIFLEDDTRIKLFNTQKDIKKNISTLGIAQAAAKLAREHGWKKAIVIAASQRQKRCVRDLKKVGVAAAKYLIPSWLETPAWGWYSSKSTRFWTRSPWLWWLREIPLRLMPWRLYKKLTT